MIGLTPQTLGNESLAVVPYALPSSKKRVKNGPEIDIAKTILVDSSPLSPLHAAPLDKSRIKSSLDKSGLGNYFVPFSKDDDCMSLTEEDLEEFYEDEEILQEGLTDEKEKAKLEFDVFLKGQNIEAHGLRLSFETFIELFKGYVSYPQILLKASEYISENKDNFGNAFKVLFPKEADGLLDVYDEMFKWADCGIPLLTNIIYGVALLHFYNRAEGIKQSTAQFVGEHESPSAHSSTDGILKSHYSICHFQSSTIGKEWKEVKRKGGLKLVRLISKTMAVGLAYVGIWGELKTANRVTKSAYELVKSGMEILDCYEMNSKQKEWLFHLQPYFLVNIEPENPTPEEEEAIEAEIDAREELIEEVKDFLVSLEKSTSLEEVEKLFKKINLPFVLPTTIVDFKQMLKNPRFVRDIVQCYYYHVGRRASISASKLNYAIEKKEEERNRKVDHYFPTMVEHISECKKQNLSFAEIQAYFAKRHIDINSISIPDADDLPVPPTNKLEWEECVQNDEFIRALAEKWIDFQEGTAQMLMQAVRQAVLSKHQVERKFLLFHAVEIGVGLFSTALQLSLCSPQVKLSTLSSVIEILITDIAKWGFPGLGAFYLGSPLYPGMKFKIEALFMQIAKHFFAIAYKPNEYSLEGYQLTLKLRWTKLVMLYYTLQFILNKAMLWTNIRLVDNCIKGLKNNDITEDKRYDDLTEQYDLFSIKYKEEVQDLENKLWELQVKDANLIINPQSQKTSDNFGPSDPIKDIADSLIDADIDYFPPLVIEFIENQIKFKLSNDNKMELEDHLKDLFVKSEDKFLSSYFSNRFDYLKA